MPLKAFGLACIVVAIGSTAADAQQIDFSKLLNSIAYPDQEAQDATADQTSAAPNIDAPRTDAPRVQAPRSLTRMPIAAEETGTHPIPRLPGAKLSTYGEIGPEKDARIVSDDALLSDDETLSADANAAQDPSAAQEANSSEDSQAVSRSGEVGSRVDFATMFAANAPSPVLPIPQSHGGGIAASTDSLHGGVAGRAPGRMCDCPKCRADLPAVPYLDQPNLPPPTSLEGYYRTPACYRDLWGGFTQQRQRECHRSHEQLHGR